MDDRKHGIGKLFKGPTSEVRVQKEKMVANKQREHIFCICSLLITCLNYISAEKHIPYCRARGISIANS